MSEQTVIIEKNQPYSKCALWTMQREYFDDKGIDAWVGQVPFYVTSNPFIAASYAEMTFAMMRAWVKKHPEALQHTFYILELGTGSGRFSYYVIKRLCELAEVYQADDIKFCYVMSDFTQSNIDFWNQQDRLQSYVKKGVLDYALYNMEIEQSIALQHKGIELNSETLHNPLTVFANYIFDTISHDVFLVENRHLFETLVTLQTNKSNLKDGKALDWKEVQLTYKEQKAKNNYYGDENFNAVLAQYRDLLNQTHITFPVGGLRAIRLLKKLANDKLFLISSDKGCSQPSDLANLNPPSIAFHGSFSIMVNFDAIGRYFKQCGGDALLQQTHEGIDSGVFTSGFELSDLPELNAAVEEHILNFSPADYFSLHRNISENVSTCNLKTLVSHLALTRFDPHIFQKLHQKIYGMIESSHSASVAYLKRILPKIAEHFYHIPRCYDVYFDLAILLHALNDCETAIEYYDRSEGYFGEQYGNYYNRALCLHSLGRVDEALAQFKRAVQLDPSSQEAQDWVRQLEPAQASGITG
ncbi:MAG: tetratricopeptide repeat protein [Gammaproteobacteria bacterium]|nr:tetratricopeptide repeat protein [Gammaproteobacteria bacterium]